MDGQVPVQNSRGNAGIVLLVVAVLAAVLGFLFWQVRLAREAAQISASQGPLNQLQLAFQNYHDAYGTFPPAYVVGPDGKPWHSWRILVCPYIDASDVHKEYRFDEPWNGPHNRNLANRIPGILHSPTEPPTDTYTNYAVIVGEHTPFPGSRATSIKDFKDGLGSTILFVEVANAKISWLEPRDLLADELSYRINDSERPGPSSSRRNGPYVVFADSISAHALTPGLLPAHLRAMTTLNRGEPLAVASARQVNFRGLTSLGRSQSVDDDLLKFADWSEVGDVWLTGSDVTDRGVAALSKANDAGSIHLAETKLTDAGLVVFRGKSMYALDLSRTGITDAGLEHLAQIANVYYVDLIETKVTRDGVIRLARALPNTGIRFESEWIRGEKLAE